MIPECALRALDRYDQAEVYVSEARIDTVYIDDSRIANIETKTDRGMMFRMVRDRRMGKASVSLCQPGSAERCLRMAESVLSVSPENNAFKGYALPAQPSIAMPDVWDRDVENITPEDLREAARTLIQNCDVSIPRAQIRTASVITRTVNGNGVDVEHRSTLVYGHFTSMHRGDHPGEGMETFHSTRFDLDPALIGRELSRKARAAAGSRGFKGSRTLTMILPPSELGDMMSSSLGAAVDGENVRYGRSRWKDSLGEAVASPELCVVDDPTVPAPLSSRFDDEGTPCQRREVISGGVLKGFLRDTFCGDSTGNGFRRSSVEAQGAYDRTPTVKPVNLCVAPGSRTREDIVAETDEGILVEKFAWPEADGLTGRFGLNVRCGYLIHRGEVTGVVSNALLTGNMLDCLGAVERIGNDPVQTGVVTVPTMSFSGTELVGDRRDYKIRRCGSP